ncbi:MAG: hypothetical protein ABSG27_05125 [Candidatus Acidiferrales bacterium]|jgi:hypothetical protein
MKKILGLAVLALGLAVPAHAQFLGASVGSGSNVGSGGGVGSVVFHVLPSVPPAHFAIVYVTGTDSFTPSAFVAYDQAVAEGIAALNLKEKSVAEVAAENSVAHAPRAKLAFVQNSAGDAVIVSR